MIELTRRFACLLLVLFPLSGSVWVAGCGPTTLTTGIFKEVNRTMMDLERGVSTKSDVQQALGAASGSGSAILPTDPTPREVWFYEDIEVTDAKAEANQVIRVNVRQQILLVFFKKELFDGFLWYSSVMPASGDGR
jgi:hypothetical protein